MVIINNNFVNFQKQKKVFTSHCWKLGWNKYKLSLQYIHVLTYSMEKGITLSKKAP